MALEKKVLKYQLCREGTYALIIVSIMAVIAVITENLGKQQFMYNGFGFLFLGINLYVSPFVKYPAYCVLGYCRKVYFNHRVLGMMLRSLVFSVFLLIMRLLHCQDSINIIILLEYFIWDFFLFMVILLWRLWEEAKPFGLFNNYKINIDQQSPQMQVLLREKNGIVSRILRATSRITMFFALIIVGAFVIYTFDTVAEYSKIIHLLATVGVMAAAVIMFLVARHRYEPKYI